MGIQKKNVHNNICLSRIRTCSPHHGSTATMQASYAKECTKDIWRICDLWLLLGMYARKIALGWFQYGKRSLSNIFGLMERFMYSNRLTLVKFLRISLLVVGINKHKQLPEEINFRSMKHRSMNMNGPIPLGWGDFRATTFLALTMLLCIIHVQDAVANLRNTQELLWEWCWHYNIDAYVIIM